MNLVCVIFEVALLFTAIREDHPPVAMLDAFYPITLITTPVGPVHLTVAVSLIIHILTFVLIATYPSEMPNTVLLISDVGSLIYVDILEAFTRSPFTFAMP